MATHSPFKADPFSSISLPLHYHRDSLKDINKYEKRLIFSSSPHCFLCLTEWLCLTCLMGITPKRKCCGFLVGTSGSLSSPSTQYPCTSSSFKISGRALYQLGRCSRLFLLGWCASHAGLPLSAASPAKILTPTSLSEPARLRLQLDYRVSGEQETAASGSPALMVYLRAPEMKTSRIDSHLHEAPPSLHLKAEQLRALHGPESSGTPTQHITGEPPSTLQAEPGHLQVEPSLMLTKEVHHPMWSAVLLRCEFELFVLYGWYGQTKLK